MDIEKDPSASTNPVTNQGSKIFELFLSPAILVPAAVW